MGLFCGSPSDGPCTADDPSECTWHAGRRPASPVNCPSCSKPMHTDRTHVDWACECGLAGPRDVLEGLAARLAKLEKDARFWLTNCRMLAMADDAGEQRLEPAVVLAEAERLLRDALVNRVGLASTLGVQVVTYVGKRGHGATLAEAYAKLTGGGHVGG